MVVLQGVAQGESGVQLVAVTPSLADRGDVPALDEATDDALRGAFGDADSLGEVAVTDPGVASHADQGVSVVGEECLATHVT